LSFLCFCWLHLQVVPETLEPSLQLAAAVLSEVTTILLLEQIYWSNGETFFLLIFCYTLILWWQTPVNDYSPWLKLLVTIAVAKLLLIFSALSDWFTQVSGQIFVEMAWAYFCSLLHGKISCTSHWRYYLFSFLVKIEMVKGESKIRF
jgi:hypothetical protein